jgi:hypothetical protein
VGRIPRGAEWRGFGAGDGSGERGSWRGAVEGQRGGGGDADLGGGGRRGDVTGEEKGNWGDSGWVGFAFGGRSRSGEDVCVVWEEDETGEFVAG